MKSRRSMHAVLTLVAALAGVLAVVPVAGATSGAVTIEPVRAEASTVVDMDLLAQLESSRPAPDATGVPRATPGPLSPATPATPSIRGLFAAPQLAGRAAPSLDGVPSPAPAQDFAGLDDIPDLSTNYRYIPPDTDGAVGLTKILSGLNNNYRIFDKSTGAVLSTVGIEDFWGGLGITWTFDPKTLYDPVNDRWIAVALAFDENDLWNSVILIGLSQTPDPSGAWSLYRFQADPTLVDWADFPTIGFNKDFIAVNVNMWGNEDWNYHGSKMLLVDYPMLQAGVATAWFADGTQYTASPGASYSPRDCALYVVTQPWEYSGTYYVDTVTRDRHSGRPVYNQGPEKDRGLTWTAPWDNILPQKPTVAYPDPMKIECQDDMVRSTPVVRDGSIYYTQTIGLPAGGVLSHTSILWTRLSTATGDVVDGGLIDDPTATVANGGKWYAYPHIAVNKYGDAIVGFSQFSSEQWPSAGYAMRAGGDPAGTMRDPVVYKAGEDIYQKDYSSGRNRWGDYSKAQVDPSNDADLWVVNEYSKFITDDALDGKRPTGIKDYGGVWGTWWARASRLTYVITPLVAGGHGRVTPSTPLHVTSGDTPTFTFRPDSGFHIESVTVDGTPVTLTGPDSYTFPPVTDDHRVVVAFAADDSYPISALPAGGGGTVDPIGTTWVPFLSSLTIRIVPAANYHVDRVTVDGLPVRATTSYTFSSVGAGHRLQASFALDSYAITPSVVLGADGRPHGAISPATVRTYAFGSTPAFRFTPETGYTVAEVRVDGRQVLPTPRTSYTFATLSGPHTISVRFVKGYVPAPQ